MRRIRSRRSALFGLASLAAACGGNGGKGKDVWFRENARGITCIYLNRNNDVRPL